MFAYRIVAMVVFKIRERAECNMTTLIIRNIDDGIVDVLKERARQHGVSMEVEHRRILETVLVVPRARRSFAAMLAQIPNVGQDSDFGRSCHGLPPCPSQPALLFSSNTSPTAS